MKRVSDYDERLMAVLVIMDKMASEISSLKMNLGIKKPKEEQVFIVPPPPIKNSFDSSISNPKMQNSLPSINIENDNASSSTNAQIESPLSKTEISKGEEPELVNKPVAATQASSKKEDSDFDKNLVKIESEVEPKKPIAKIEPLSIVEEKNEPAIVSNILPESSVNNRVIKPVQSVKLQRPINHPKNNKRQSFDHGMEINNLLLEGGYALVRSDLYNAINIYRKVLEIYNPSLDRNKSTYNRIMRFYDNIRSISNRPANIHRFNETIRF
ncbi:Uncharacterised protein [uncultured archaeon]|nr:Uncharacterised protein [uncultured archaeon]